MSDQHQASYESRKAIADAIDADIAAAVAVLGPGAKAYGAHVVRDTTGQEPERRFYCCRRDCGWEPALETYFDRALERRTDKWFDNPKTGERFYYFRYSTGIAVFTPYRPQTPEQLAAAAEKRTQKKLDAEVAAMPLFADEVREMQRSDADAR